MPLVPCPKCGKQMSTDYANCFQCGTPVQPTRTAAKPTRGSRPQSSTILGYPKSEWIAAPFVGLGVFAVLMWLGAEDSPEEIAARRERDCTDTTMAFVMSQEFVKRQLRAPATAEFPYSTAAGVNSRAIGNCKFRVTGYVDAQNAFGAMIRTPYYAELERLPDEGTWRVVDLTLD